eukprot:GHVS01016241.1.p1 GENE.GHVS01016241.1~~GHVS01016241.1.p1  ORF type:complete len:144 (+),score=27.76 GHVS01016241.1:570-1001(+)
MKGKVDPLIGAENALAGTSSWYLTFNRGGCGTFLNLFFRLHLEATRNASWTPTPDLTTQLAQGTGAAFVDPNDPSIVYLTQPLPSAPPIIHPPPTTPAHTHTPAHTPAHTHTPVSTTGATGLPTAPPHDDGRPYAYPSHYGQQ